MDKYSNRINVKVMDKTDILINWTNKTILNLLETGDSNSIHFSDLFDFNYENSKEFIYKVLELSSKLKNSICKQINPSFEMYIHLALLDDEEITNIVGVPRSFDDLLEIIDVSFSPDIILYKKTDSGISNDFEYYRSIIPFQISQYTDLKLVYQELRPIDDFDEPFQRDLNIIILE